MKALGVYLNIALGDRNGNMTICTVGNESGENKVLDLHVGEVGSNFSSISETIHKIFLVNKCDYIAIDSSGIMIRVYEELEKLLGDKVVSIKPDILTVDKMISMLQSDDTLSRVGLTLSTIKKNGAKGLRQLLSDSYGDFEISMVTAIGLANMVLNIENLKQENRRHELEKRLEDIERKIDYLINK